MAQDFPAPLVPAEVDLSGFGSFMLDVDRLLASELVAIGTPEECWAAVLLWCRAWKQTPAGSLPDDPRILAAFSGTGKRWPKVQAIALRGFVKCSDGRLYHKVLAEKANEAWERRKTFKDRSAKANEKRWGAHAAQHEPAGSGEGQQGARKEPKTHPPHDLQGMQQGAPKDPPSTHPDGSNKDSPKASLKVTKREGEGEGIDNRATSSSSLPDPDRDLVRRIRIAMGSEPVIATAEHPTGILRMLDAGRADGSVVEADVFAGITAMFERAELGFRVKRYGQVENWIRGAGKDRLAGKPRAAPGRATQAEPAGSTLIRGVAVPNERIQARVDHFEATGEWPDDVRDRWGPAPGEGGSCIPSRFLQPKVPA